MQFFALAIFLVMSIILVMIPSASAEDHDVSITDDMKFNPEDLTINVGDTVTWTNNDGMGHTATSTSGPTSFDSGNIASGGTCPLFLHFDAKLQLPFRPYLLHSQFLEFQLAYLFDSV